MDLALKALLAILAAGLVALGVYFLCLALGWCVQWFEGCDEDDE